MNSTPFIDIHTHHAVSELNLIRVRNLFPGDAIPVFSGRNFFSVGLHPWKIKSEEENNNFLQMMEDALEFDHVIFVGECGLDKFAETDYKEQLRVFRAHVFMAEEYQKPLIIHCVKGWNEILEVLKYDKPTVPWIFHGYNGSKEFTGQLAEKNCMFSFGELLFKESTRAIESFQFLPLEKIFFETDDSLRPLEAIYNRGAELKNVQTEKLKETIWGNFNRIENVSLNI